MNEQALLEKGYNKYTGKEVDVIDTCLSRALKDMRPGETEGMSEIPKP